MCLPLCILRFQMYIGGAVHLLIGILIIIFAFIVNGFDKKEIPDEYESNVETAFLGILIFGIIILISGFFGIFGGIKKQKCLILIFVIVTNFFFLIALILAIAVQLGQNFVDQSVGDKCLDFFKNEQYSLQEATKYYCNNSSGDGCPCYIQDKTMTQWLNSNVNLETYNRINSTRKRSTSGTVGVDKGYSKFVDCEEYIEFKNASQPENLKILINWSDINSYQQFFETIETKFECSGLCDKEPLYFFSNSNTGLPKSYLDGNGCYRDIFDELVAIMKNVSVPLWISTIFFFLNILFGCCLMYHPQKDEYYNKESNPSAKSEVYK